MYFYEIARIVELLLVLIGLFLIIVGLIVPYKQSVVSTKQQQEFEKKLLSAKWEKELIDEQISKFYGPIAELLREQALRKELICEQLGRRTIFQSGRDKFADWPESEQKIWIHFIDTYTIPTLNKVVKIIRNNTHLMVRSDMPNCFKMFMEYAIGFELLDNQKRNGVPNYYEYYYSYNYPRDFNLYIEQMLSMLLKRQNELIEIAEQ